MSDLRLSPTSLSQYIRFDNCERFLRFSLVPEDRKRLEKKWGLTIQPLTPLLKEAGAEFEEGIAETLATQGEQIIDLQDKEFSETIHWFQNVKSPTILLQPVLEAPLGNFTCSGKADLIHLSRDRKNQLKISITDIKATRTEKTEHRVQVAAYAKMAQHLVSAYNIPAASIQGSVLIQQDDGSYPSLQPDSSSFDLDTYLSIVDRLVVIPDSVVNRIVDQPFEAAFYHLNYKCDGCFFNSLCMFDSAERLDLTLTPQISAVEKRVLTEAGISNIKQLADLMDFPEDGQYEMRPSSASSQSLEELQNKWLIAPNLPFLVQRAKAAVRVFDKTEDYRPFIYGSGFGGLPDENEYPDLVKVFFDAQRDYLTDHLYLFSGLILGPQGERTVVKCAEHPPDNATERELLVSWVREVLTAVRDVSTKDNVPIHLYCYNRYDQKALLDALKRHISEVAALPAFFDLMTQSPALTQPIISFLSDELQERLNMGRVCAPLHDAARWRRFDWKDDQYEYYRLFRARMFDNRRDVIRSPKGALVQLDYGDREKNPDKFTIESSSRFNSQIPLEYAYAAWDCLPEEKEDSRLLEPFRKVDLNIMKGFAAMRVRALSHIEASFKFKSKKVGKLPIYIPDVSQPDNTLSLARSIREFLYMEHHTSLQNHLIIFGMPIERRVQSGLAMLLRFEKALGNSRYLFKPEFSSLGLDPVLAINACKLKEGDWIVFNPIHPPLSANQIKHGRLGIIEKINQDSVIIELLGITFRNGDFRYYHNNRIEPDPGDFYTIDPMVDELNADKMLEAIAHCDNNVFHHWLLNPPPNRNRSQQLEDFFVKFADYVNALLKNRRMKLTKPQSEAITEHFDKPLVLIQGPPGTGKSYTLAWAILARIASAGIQGKPCRVLISCKTHNAILVVLAALAQVQAQVGTFAPNQIGGQAIFGTEIYKIVNNLSDPAPAGVRKLNVYNQKSTLENLLSKPYFVIGATSGAVFNLMKYRALGGGQVDWNTKTFDLVVIDEASQMSLPEGVLAGAFLKPEGTMIVVGDHRQMPPIIAHPWKDEQKRSAIEERPFISLFEFLNDRDFPCVKLDQSFRLHYEIAEFLRENIYSKDGINFFSKRKELIHQMPQTNQYVDNVLNPNYPIVVIEHTEHDSQQFNPLELELTEPLIEACVRHLSLDGRTGIGIVVPHRAQKALLRARFPDLADVNSIDTVERFQGDERDVIIVSATASDPDYVRYEADFLLNLNRLNVAISRPRMKLIVIASRSVIDLLVSDLEIFENAVIWKRLYHHYTPDLLYEWNSIGYKVSVRGRKAG